jgi:phosphopantothenoylcysteine decarboxylase/phosphopantothenate--cysteine ligase
MTLKKRTIATGGIAAYKAAALTRLLVKSGRRAMTMTVAARFVTPGLLTLTGQAVWTDLGPGSPTTCLTSSCRATT